MKAEIRAEDFPLFYDEDILKLHWLSAYDVIIVERWYNWKQYEDLDVEKISIVDCYYPKEVSAIDDGDALCWELNEYSTYPVSVESFISIIDDENEN